MYVCMYVLFLKCKKEELTLRVISGPSQMFSFVWKRKRKGCPTGYFLILSPDPLLFNLYINDLPFAFENTLSDPFVLPNGAKLNSLLYADDLIILSRSKTELQNCLDKLSSFCTS